MDAKYMKLKKFIWSLTAAFGIAGATAATAEEVSAEQVQALIQRLEQAEQEIRDLKAERPASPSDNPFRTLQSSSDPSTTVRPTAFQREEPSPTDQGVADQALRIGPEGRGAAEADRRQEDFDLRLRDLEARWSVLDGDEKIDAITDEFEDFGSRIKDLEQEEINFVKRGTKNATMQLFGRLHADYVTYPSSDAGAAQYETGDPEISPQDRFVFRRIRIGVKGDISPNMFYKVETEFPDPNDFEFRDMYLGWRNVPFFQTIVLGNHKRPYGLDHLNSSRYNVFTGRPFVIEAFNEDTRRLGLSSNGVSDDLDWNWRYGVWALERIQDDGEYRGDAYQMQVAGRLARTYWYDEASGGRGYGHFAVAGTVADPDETGGPANNNEARFRTRPEARTTSRWLNTGRIADVERFSVLGLEHVLNIGAFQWTSEVQGLWNQRNDGSEDLFMWGGYTYVSYFLTGEHMPWSRDSGTLGRPKPHENFFWVDTCDGCRGGGLGAWQIAARFSHLDMNDGDIFGGEGTSVTAGLNWYYNSNASLQFNYIWGWIDDASVVDGDYIPGNQADSDYQIATARIRIDF